MHVWGRWENTCPTGKYCCNEVCVSRKYSHFPRIVFPVLSWLTPSGQFTLRKNNTYESTTTRFNKVRHRILLLSLFSYSLHKDVKTKGCEQYKDLWPLILQKNRKDQSKVVVKRTSLSLWQVMSLFLMGKTFLSDSQFILSSTLENQTFVLQQSWKSIGI